MSKTKINMEVKGMKETKTATICCKCKEPITGFVAHKDQCGEWCENCSGTYDYEREEARDEAVYLIEDAIESDAEPEYINARIDRVLNHWKKVLEDENFQEFKKHYLYFIRKGK